MKDYNDFKYTCLFGGGAIRGAGHVGVLKAFDELGITLETLGGSSVGSIVASLFAVGYTYEELAEVFLSVNFELFRDVAFGFSQKFALSKGEVFLEWIRDLIEKKYYGDKYKKGENPPVLFKDINKNLVIVTTDMKKFTCCEFSNFETPDFEIAMAVRISCCMPGLMRAVNFEDCLLVDGDLMKGKPMWYLSKNLRNIKGRILEIRLEGTFSGTDESPIEYVNGMYTCMTYSETEFIKDLYGKNDKYDYLTIDTGNVVVVDFNYPPEKRQDIIDDGYKQTIKYFKKSLVSKKQKILGIYLEILDKFRKIQEFILIGKFNKAKCIVAELFIFLSETKDFIDNELFNSIFDFQKLLYENVKSGLLGRAKLDNKDTVKTKLTDVILDLTMRVKNLEFYINKFFI